MNRSLLVMVDDVNLLVVVFAEGNDALLALGQLLVPNDFVAVEAGAPDFARHPVAAQVDAGEFLQTFATVDIPAGDGGRLGVGKVQGRGDDRRGAAFAFGAHRLRAFHDRPAIVAAFLDAIDHLPLLPADIADPEIAGRAIEAHAPGIAEAIGP